jgi:hypothetical protein
VYFVCRMFTFGRGVFAVDLDHFSRVMATSLALRSWIGENDQQGAVANGRMPRCGKGSIRVRSLRSSCCSAIFVSLLRRIILALHSGVNSRRQMDGNRAGVVTGEDAAHDLDFDRLVENSLPQVLVVAGAAVAVGF